MGTKKSNLKSAALFTGAIFAGTAAIASENGENENILRYSSLGSGSELRSELLDLNKSILNNNKDLESPTTVKFSELKCGEGKCGEGTCGEDKKSEKKEVNKDEAKSEVKGEAKGEVADVKKETKTETTSESKTDESSCGASEESKAEVKK